jgi:hypothetical protein
MFSHTMQYYFQGEWGTEYGELFKSLSGSGSAEEHSSYFQ